METLPIIGIEVSSQLVPFYYGLAALLGIVVLGTLVSAIGRPSHKVSFTRGIDLYDRPLTH